MSQNPVRPSRSPLLSLTVAVVCAGAFALAYFFTVRTVSGRQVADASLRGATGIGPDSGGMVEGVLDVISVASLLGAVAVIAVIALIRLRRGQGLAAIALMVGANLSAQVLKEFVLTRPDLGLDEIAPVTLNSLPSGHSTAAFSAVMALLLVVPARLRAVTAVSGGVYACLTGVATMLAGWHRAADSMAAFFLVGIWVGLVTAVVVLMGGSANAGPQSVSGRGARTGRQLSMVAVWTFAIGLLMVALLATDDSIREGSMGPRAAFVAGALLVIGAAAVVLAAALAAVARIAAPPAPSDAVPTRELPVRP
jgi:membrane-associated phospholipid phosphatase